MKWYKFDSLNDFNVWHQNIKEKLGYPKISVDINGNEMLDATITDSYTLPIIISNEDIRVFINDDFSEGLVSSESPYLPDERYEVTTITAGTGTVSFA